MILATEAECLHEHNGDCFGLLSIITGTSGMLLVLCNHHELDYYKRQDTIKSNYWDNSPEY